MYIINLILNGDEIIVHVEKYMRIENGLKECILTRHQMWIYSMCDASNVQGN